MSPLAALDLVTGAEIRASRSTQVHDERKHHGGLVRVDGKNLGRIPDGGGGCADALPQSAPCVAGGP